MGLIFDVKRFSLHDGPGIRTTVFFKGCPLECVWCQNPESILPEPEEIFRESLCIHCGECSQGCCTGARETVGLETTPEELLQEILRDRAFYHESSGGVTFSGGEPLMQLDFLLEMLTSCRSMGIHAAVDTAGAVPTDHIRRVSGNADLFLYDLKHVDNELHREFTGMGNGVIIENLRYLAENGSRVVVRIPVVDGFNSDRGSMEAIASFLKGVPGIRFVELLRCHDMAREKYRGLGREHSCYVPHSDIMVEFTRVLKSAGIRLGGVYS